MKHTNFRKEGEREVRDSHNLWPYIYVSIFHHCSCKPPAHNKSIKSKIEASYWNFPRKVCVTWLAWSKSVWCVVHNSNNCSLIRGPSNVFFLHKTVSVLSQFKVLHFIDWGITLSSGPMMGTLAKLVCWQSAVDSMKEQNVLSHLRGKWNESLCYNPSLWIITL